MSRHEHAHSLKGNSSARDREATDKLHKEVLTGTRWLLLKNPENLDPKRRERQRLEEALKLNQPSATVPGRLPCTIYQPLVKFR